MSALEDQLMQQIADAGLPMPVTQFKLVSERLWTKHRPPRLTAWWFDLCWPRYRLMVEVDGATWARGRHTRGAGYESDCEKAGEAAERDWTVLRFTGEMVKDGRAVARVRRIIEHRQQVRWICVCADDTA